MRSHEPITWRELALHAAICFVVLILLFPGVFLRGELAVPWTVLYHHAPWNLYMPEGETPAANRSAAESIQHTFSLYVTVERSLAQGKWPLWNHLQFCGTPLLANGQISVFYPPRLLHAVIDVWTASSLFVLFRVWLCGATAYLCARGLGLGVAAARFMGLGWMLCMLNMVWVYWPVPDSCAWAPILLLGAERVIDARYRQGFFTLAFGGAMILLAGHPETAFTLSFGVGMYLVIRLALDRRTGGRLLRPLAIAFAAWIPALCLAAVQVLPLLEYLVNSYTFQSRGSEGHAVPSLAFRGLVCFWVPRFFGATVDANIWGIKEESSATYMGQAVGNTNHMSFVYVGVVMWVAIALALPWIRRDRLIRHRAIALFATGSLGLLLALEHPWVAAVHRLPMMSAIVRTYHAYFLVFGLIVFGAHGIDLLSKKKIALRDLRWPGLLMAGIAAFVAVAWIIERDAIAVANVGQYVGVQILIAGVLTLATSAVVALTVRQRFQRIGIALLTVLLAADLMIAARGLRATASRAEIETVPKIFQVARELDPSARFALISAEIIQGVAQSYDIEVMQGYDAILTDRFRRFVMNSKNYWSKMEATTATKYWLFKEDAMSGDSEKYRRVATADGFAIYENRLGFPRAYLVGAVERVESADAVFDRLADDDFDPATAVVTEVAIEQAPSQASRDVGSARIEERTGNYVRIEVDAARDCALVLSDTFFPGWLAEIDGEKTYIFPANYAFRGILVPQGRHVVEFRYSPLSFRLGLVVSTLCAVLSIIVIGYMVWLSKARQRKSV